MKRVKVKCPPHYYVIPRGELVGTCCHCGEHRRFISYTELSKVIDLKKYHGKGVVNRYIARLGIEATLIPYTRKRSNEY